VPKRLYPCICGRPMSKQPCGYWKAGEARHSLSFISSAARSCVFRIWSVPFPTLPRRCWETTTQKHGSGWHRPIARRILRFRPKVEYRLTDWGQSSLSSAGRHPKMGGPAPLNPDARKLRFRQYPLGRITSYHSIWPPCLRADRHHSGRRVRLAAAFSVDRVIRSESASPMQEGGIPGALIVRRGFINIDRSEWRPDAAGCSELVSSSMSRHIISGRYAQGGVSFRRPSCRLIKKRHIVKSQGQI